MPSARSTLRPAVRPKIVKKKSNKFVRIEADMFKRMKVRCCWSLLVCSADVAGAGWEASRREFKRGGVARGGELYSVVRPSM